MNQQLTHSAALFLIVGLTVIACDRATTERAEADARRAGAKVEGALDRTGQKLSEAAQKTEQKISEGSEKLAPKVQAAGDRIGEAAQRTGDKIASATTSITTGEKTSVSLSGVSDDTKARLSDAAITASIKADFVKDPGLSALKIDVDTQGGVVTLNGFARDAAAAERAGQIARAVHGVREVRNHVTAKQG